MAPSKEQPSLDVFEIWERVGVTEHWGGFYASQELFRMCEITSNQRILEIGCGTGYTATQLAKRNNLVTAIDLDPKLIDIAQQRAEKASVDNRVIFIEDDAENLYFNKDAFDRVIAESVLIFTNPAKSLAEAYRVLKPEGILGINEVTVIDGTSPRAQQITEEFKSKLGLDIPFLTETQWLSLLSTAGFTDILSVVHHFDPKQQFISHMRIDGLTKFLYSVYYSLAKPEIRKAFFNKEIASLAADFGKYMGYGLYRGKKSE